MSKTIITIQERDRRIVEIFKGCHLTNMLDGYTKCEPASKENEESCVAAIPDVEGEARMDGGGKGAFEFAVRAWFAYRRHQEIVKFAEDFASKFEGLVDAQDPDAFKQILASLDFKSLGIDTDPLQTDSKIAGDLQEALRRVFLTGSVEITSGNPLAEEETK